MACTPQKIATAQCLSCPNYGGHLCPMFHHGDIRSLNIAPYTANNNSTYDFAPDIDQE